MPFNLHAQNIAPVIIGVVGHTNTGKTSLVRTLLRLGRFGEIADRAGTTRHVEAAQLMIQGRPVIELRDTPGLEDSIALAELLQTIIDQGNPGRKALQYLIEHHQAHSEFEQEIKVLKQALACDVLFYVIDCRDDVLEKYRQELQSLSLAARPILPVLNFLNTPNARPQLWRETLADLRLHATVEFDTVAFDFEAEKRLYQKMQTLLEPRYEQLQFILEHRQQEWQQLRRAVIHQVASMLADVALMKTETARATATEQDTNRALTGAVSQLQDKVRSREQQCLKTILNVLQFDSAELILPELPVTDDAWSMDLFSPDTLKTFGRDTASAAATGAAIGAGVDLLLAGLSLGAATATGALLGTAWNTSRRYGRDLKLKFGGTVCLGVDAATFEVLTLRQLLLMNNLFRRGHADQRSISIDDDKTAKTLPEGWPRQLKNLRQLQASPEAQREARYQSAVASLEEWLGRLTGQV